MAVVTPSLFFRVLQLDIGVIFRKVPFAAVFFSVVMTFGAGLIPATHDTGDHVSRGAAGPLVLLGQGVRRSAGRGGDHQIAGEPKSHNTNTKNNRFHIPSLHEVLGGSYYKICATKKYHTISIIWAWCGNYSSLVMFGM
jgi:hypothetical protein